MLEPSDWGISYGTVIGQYMVKILPPERLGKIVVDGVVDAAQWSENASATLEGILVLQMF